MMMFMVMFMVMFMMVFMMLMMLMMFVMMSHITILLFIYRLQRYAKSDATRLQTPPMMMILQPSCTELAKKLPLTIPSKVGGTSEMKEK